MPLHILLNLVIGGIAGIALALHLLGLSKAVRLNGPELRAHWQRHYPDDTFDNDATIDMLTNSAANRAIVKSDQGYGLIWTMGADTCARRLDAARWRETAKGVACRFDDPAAPRIDIPLSQDERSLWLAYLRKFHGA